MFSYVSIEDRIPVDHPLRAMHALVQPILRALSPRFEVLYSWMGRPLIPPERRLRALLLQALYTSRSERQLLEQLDYNLLFRWFVGLNRDDPIWVPTVFSKNRAPDRRRDRRRISAGGAARRRRLRPAFGPTLHRRQLAARRVGQPEECPAQ